MDRLTYQEWLREHTRMVPGELDNLEWHTALSMSPFYLQANVELAGNQGTVYFRCSVSEMVVRCTREQWTHCVTRCPNDTEMLLRRVFSETMVQEYAKIEVEQ